MSQSRPSAGRYLAHLAGANTYRYQSELGASSSHLAAAPFPFPASFASMATTPEKRGSSPTSDPEVTSENEKARITVYDTDVDTSAVDEKKLLWKMDLALIPWLSFLYLLSFLDRTSIGKYVCSPALE